VLNPKPAGELRSGISKKRIVIVIARARHVSRECNEPGRDRPDMKVMDVRHVWQTSWPVDGVSEGSE